MSFPKAEPVIQNFRQKTEVSAVLADIPVKVVLEAQAQACLSRLM
jgi:glucokinase